MVKFSIITINLNNSDGLRRTIESCISQSFKDYEYIIIDGGSNDESLNVIKDYSDRIHRWISEPDKGLYHAINKGIKLSNGQWIGIINSGDWYEQDTLEKVNSVVSKNIQHQIVHGCIRVWKNGYVFKIQGVHSSFLPNGMIEHPACFVHKEVYQKIGVFDLDYKVSSDYEFMLRAFTKNIKFHFIDKILANFTLGGISSTSALTSVETKKIRQKYGFESAKAERGRLSKIYHAFRHLVGLLLPEKIHNIIRSIAVIFRWLIDFLKNIDQVFYPKRIPIIINNFNRLTYLKVLVNSLDKKGYKNIFIIDNASTFPPLLDYYKVCPYKILKLKENKGHKALWNSNLIKKFSGRFFAYTDPDLELPDECPDDFVKLFLKTLWKHPKIEKVGFSLKISDIPEYYAFKREVIEWESKFYKKKTGNLFLAPVDTTFALHRPSSSGRLSDNISFRTDYPYQIRHLPWYENSSNLSEEERFYNATKKRDIGMWSGKLS